MTHHWQRRLGSAGQFWHRQVHGACSLAERKSLQPLYCQELGPQLGRELITVMKMTLVALK